MKLVPRVTPGMWMPGGKWYVDQHSLVSAMGSRLCGLGLKESMIFECSLCWDGIVYVWDHILM